MGWWAECRVWQLRDGREAGSPRGLEHPLSLNSFPTSPGLWLAPLKQNKACSLQLLYLPQPSEASSLLLPDSEIVWIGAGAIAQW